MTKKDSMEICKTILKNEVGYELNDEEFRTVLGYLVNHKDVRKKLGIKSIYIGTAKEAFNSKCFHIRRSDDTTTDFSYKSCFQPKTKEAEFKEACRWAVWPQIIDFVEKKFNGYPQAECEVTGQFLTRSEVHVHHDGLAFKDIINNFVLENNIDLNKVELTESKDNQVRTEFVDQTVKQKFFDYHKQKAKLMLISKEEHKKAHICV